MKNILVSLAFIIFLVSFSLAEDINTTQDTNDTLADLPKQKSIFLSYEDIPSKVYVGEVFPIKVKAMIANGEFEDISNNFIKHDENLTVLNPESKWQWFSDNIFFNTYYMQVKTKDTKLPQIKFNLLLESEIIESETLKSAQTNIIKLNGGKNFSHVIAKELDVKRYKTTYFNDKSYIIVLEIEAKQSNLGDFHLKSVEKDGIDSYEDELPFYKILYYAIIPEYQKKFTFTYFNTTLDDFKKIVLPIEVDEDKVSTQIDLNPKESSLQIYKNITLGTLLLILIILFFRRKKFIYLVFIASIIGFFIYEKLPVNNIKITADTKIKILPTKNSTIFYLIDRPMYAEKLATKNEYIKILLPNGKIGWIKEDSVIKD